MSTPLLSVQGLTITYRRPGLERIVAANDVSFSLERGEVLGLVGESGCGKSTLARAVCGLERSESGQILFNGNQVKPLKNRRRPPHLMGIQMVFQNPYASLNPRRTVASQIEDGIRASPKAERWSVTELLEEVELERSAATRFPHEFSGGQRQRIAIARAIAAGPDLLIGDEPIASLDASLQSKIALLMRKLAFESDAALLFISHDLAVVRVVADQAAVMQRGRIVERGPVAEIWEHPQDPYTQRLLSAIPVVDGLGRLPG
ncbi:ABC transporter ATP-binding protein [Agromyces sp. CCNWLW203]|uniref:ABC transporter ATP-binding protein n=1 Tax=Agromyces sp. CCNWLW203 TaxID=3112842 RepID=UPI002F9666A6